MGRASVSSSEFETGRNRTSHQQSRNQLKGKLGKSGENGGQGKGAKSSKPQLYTGTVRKHEWPQNEILQQMNGQN